MGTVSCSSSQMDILPGSPQVPHTCSGFSGFPFHLNTFLSTYSTPTHHLGPPALHTPLEFFFHLFINSKTLLSTCHHPGGVPDTGDILVVKHTWALTSQSLVSWGRLIPSKYTNMCIIIMCTVCTGEKE